MNSERRVRPRALAFLLGATLAAASCRPSPAPSELYVVWSSDVLSLDPNEKFEVVTDTVAMNVFEPLVRYDRKMEFQPALATSWEIVDGGAWRFHLRPGVRFQDGSPLTADDVVRSIDRVRSSETSDLTQYLEPVGSVKAVDPLTVDVVSRRPAGLLAVLSFVYVLPMRTLEARGARAFFESPVGTGPYRIAEWKKGLSVRLEAWDGYWGGAPAVRSAVFLKVEDGEAMWAAAREHAPAIVVGPPRATWKARRSDPAFSLLERPGLAVHFLALRVRGPDNPLSDVRVRRALRAAIDYQTLARDTAGEGAFPASQLVPPAIVGFNPGIPVPVFEPGKTRRLLAEARVRLEKPLRMLCLRGQNPLADALVAEFAAAGVAVARDDADPVSFDARFRSCDADLLLSGWVCSTGDASEILEGNFYGRTAASVTTCGYSRPDVDDAIDRIGATLDPEKRRDLLQATMQTVLDDVPWIPLLVVYDRFAMTRGLAWEPRPDGQVYLPDVKLPGR